MAQKEAINSTVEEGDTLHQTSATACVNQGSARPTIMKTPQDQRAIDRDIETHQSRPGWSAAEKRRSSAPIANDRETTHDGGCIDREPAYLPVTCPGRQDCGPGPDYSYRVGDLEYRDRAVCRRRAQLADLLLPDCGSPLVKVSCGVSRLIEALDLPVGITMRAATSRERACLGERSWTSQPTLELRRSALACAGP